MARETLLCGTCGGNFTRERVRGRKPKACPSCRQNEGSPAPGIPPIPANSAPPVDPTPEPTPTVDLGNGIAVNLPIAGTPVEVNSYRSRGWLMPGFEGTISSYGMDGKGTFARIATAHGERLARLENMVFSPR